MCSYHVRARRRRAHAKSIVHTRAAAPRTSLRQPCHPFRFARLPLVPAGLGGRDKGIKNLSRREIRRTRVARLGDEGRANHSIAAHHLRREDHAARTTCRSGLVRAGRSAVQTRCLRGSISVHYSA